MPHQALGNHELLYELLKDTRPKLLIHNHGAGASLNLRKVNPQRALVWAKRATLAIGRLHNNYVGVQKPCLLVLFQGLGV